MNTQIEFDEDNKAFGFDEWEYLNFRNTSPYCCDKCAKSAEEIKLLKKQLKQAVRNTKISENKLNSLLSQCYQIQNFVFEDLHPVHDSGFWEIESFSGSIISRYKRLKDKFLALKSEKKRWDRRINKMWESK